MVNFTFKRLKLVFRRMKKTQLLKKKMQPENPWEATFGKIITPFEQFIHGEINSGILLVFCTIIALFLANSQFSEAYFHFLHVPLSLEIGSFKLSLSLHHWINDGLMALFFFLVGLEIKREILVGELSVLRQAMLPVCAAIGGMVVPAFFYHLLNPAGSVGEPGWGIPMATDIAFAVTALVILGSRIPKSLMTFLVALAIVDDMGAVLVIAIFYTSDLNMTMMFGVLACLGILILLNMVGVTKTIPYAIFGIIMWVFMLKTGVHATVAGILTAMTIPASSKYNPRQFDRNARILLDKFEIYRKSEKDFLTGTRLQSVLRTLGRGIFRATPPLQRMENSQHIPVNFIVIPIFALANAGVPIDLSSVNTLVTDSVTLGVIVGLLLGKPIGITLACYLSIKLKLCSLPSFTTMNHIIGAGFLAGIGFTMSIFISELAFRDNQAILNNAKTGILIASILAAFVGFFYLYILDKKKKTKAEKAKEATA